MQLYLLRDGKPVGPFDEAQIVERWKRGILNGSDLVWGESLEKWTPLKNIVVDERTPQELAPKLR